MESIKQRLRFFFRDMKFFFLFFYNSIKGIVFYAFCIMFFFCVLLLNVAILLEEKEQNLWVKLWSCVIFCVCGKSPCGSANNFWVCLTVLQPVMWLCHSIIKLPVVFVAFSFSLSTSLINFVCWRKSFSITFQNCLLCCHSLSSFHNSPSVVNITVNIYNSFNMIIHIKKCSS